MRTLLLALPAVLFGIFFGCAHRTEPITPQGSSALPVSAFSPGTVAAVARWQVTVAGLSATVVLEPSRRDQETDDLYLLDVAPFFRTEDFRVTAVAEDSTTLTLSYRIRHPFPAPSDPTGPSTAQNRADLGFGGMTLFVNDLPIENTRTFFDGEGGVPVIANTDLVVNPDGYYRPAGLIDPDAGRAGNTFPFRRLVVEEGGGNRIGHPSGKVEGNYDLTVGWQQDTFGADNASWKGFGILHQGQAVTNKVQFSKAALSPLSPLKFEAVLIAKYNDPRGGASAWERATHRLRRRMGQRGGTT